MKTDQHLSLYFKIYLGMIAVTLIIFLISISIDHSYPNAHITDFSASWSYTPEAAETADLKHLSKNPLFQKNTPLLLYATLPTFIGNNTSLWLRANNCMVDIYIGDLNTAVKRVSTGKGKAIYGQSRGTLWINVPLDVQDSGKLVKLIFTPCYNDTSCYIDNIKLGSQAALIKQTITNQFMALFTCFLMLFIGVVLLIFYFVLKYVLPHKDYDLLYLGIFALVSGCWALSETKILQLFMPNTGVLHTFSCMSIMLVIMPLFLFFVYNMKKDSWLTKLIPALTILNFIICTLLHFMGIADFHETLFSTHFLIAFASVYIIGINIQYFFKRHFTALDFVAYTGIIILCLASIIDIVRYRISTSSDSSLGTRIGLLIYISSLGLYSILRSAQVVKKSMTADLVSRLAYEDGLTGLGNRTAYMEKIETINPLQPTTIFLFDINNLKYVNDHDGHLAGDHYIISGSENIQKVFGKIGNCYRIGGDEFVCLVPQIVDTDALNTQFLSTIEQYNAEHPESFPLQIAIGATICQPNESIDQAVKRADTLMYACKKQLKSIFQPPNLNPNKGPME